MFRFIVPILLLVVSVGTFLLYIDPAYGDIKSLRTDSASYDEALNNSKILQSIRGELSDKYKNFPATDLDRLKKLLPDNVDNIRLILQIQRIAAPYGMTLKNVKFDVVAPVQTQAGFATGGAVASAPKKNYEGFDLEFSTEGSYTNFTAFLQDLEKSLRIVDVNSISFTSSTATPGSDIYKYDFKIKTYWFKG